MKPIAGCLLALAAGCTAVEAPPLAEERRASAPDGVSIAYEVAGAGEPTLVFVHGWACDRGFWRGTMHAFAAQHRVVALDLAGHGASGAARETWTLDAFAGDVAAVVADVDAERVILIGHSMGAPVALLAAPRLAPRVLGVIGVESLHDATSRYPPDFLENSAVALEADFPKAMEAAIRPTIGSGAAPELGDWILARALRTDRRAASALLRGLSSFELAPAL